MLDPESTLVWLGYRNETCNSKFTGRLHLVEDQIYILVVLNTFCMLLGFFSNLIVMCVITSEKVKNNPSMTLMLSLCVADMGVNLVTIPLNISLYCTVIADDYKCNLDLAMEFFAVCFGHASAYITAIIGYDRHLRMKHLNGYSEVMPMWKVYCAVPFIVFLSIMHAIAQIFGIRDDNYGIVVLVGSCVDVLLLVLMVMPYVLLVRVIGRQRSNSVNSELLQDIDHLVNSIAFRIVIAVVLMYTPYIILSAIRVLLPADSPIIEDKTFAAFWCFSHDLTFASSLINAVIFISISPTCRKKIKQICERWICPANQS